MDALHCFPCEVVAYGDTVWRVCALYVQIVQGLGVEVSLGELPSVEAWDDVPSLNQHDQPIGLSHSTDLCIFSRLRVRSNSTRLLCDSDAQVQLISRVQAPGRARWLCSWLVQLTWPWPDIFDVANVHRARWRIVEVVRFLPGQPCSNRRRRWDSRCLRCQQCLRGFRQPLPRQQQWLCLHRRPILEGGA